MAATRLIALHINKGKTVAQCLADRTDYTENAAKTEDGKYISAYACDAKTCDEEFLLSKRQYEHITGRTQAHDVIAYQIRQSFKPGEITPEEANKVGYETAMRFTKGKHAFIVATHVDRAHIHNHIIFNSTTLDSTRKFRDFRLSGLALARLSDIVCLEHRLSVIIRKPYDNPVGVLTNNPPFPSQMFALNNYAGVSRKQPESTFAGVLQLDAYSRGMGGMGIPGDLSSQSRFVKVAFTKLNSISGEEEDESVSQFFHILGSVDQQRGCCEVTEGKYEITIYTSCCNTAKGIYYYTTYDNHQITAVDMHAENLDSDQLICYPLLSKGEVRWQNK